MAELLFLMMTKTERLQLNFQITGEFVVLTDKILMTHKPTLHNCQKTNSPGTNLLICFYHNAADEKVNGEIYLSIN